MSLQSLVDMQAVSLQSLVGMQAVSLQSFVGMRRVTNNLGGHQSLYEVEPGSLSFTLSLMQEPSQGTLPGCIDLLQSTSGNLMDITVLALCMSI